MNARHTQQFGTAFLLAGVALAGSAFLLNRIPPEYRAIARVRIQTSVSAGGSQAVIPVASDSVLSNVVEKFGLAQSRGERYAHGQTLDNAAAVQMVRQRVELAPVINEISGNPTAVTEIRVTEDQPTEAAQIANAIAEQIVDGSLAKNHESIVNSAADLARQWETKWNSLELKIRETRSNLNALRLQMHISETDAPPTDAAPEKRESFYELEGALGRLRFQLEDLKTNVMSSETKMAVTIAEIVDHAKPPQKPFRPSPALKLSLIVSGIAFALAGIALLIVPRWFSTRARKPR